MAKKIADSALPVATEALVYLETSESTVRLPWSGEIIRVADIPPTSIAYLLQYGTNKTGQDAASGAIKTAKDAHDAQAEGKATDTQTKALTKWCSDLGISHTTMINMSADAFGRMVADHLSTTRWSAVMAGKMELPGMVSRLSQIERIATEIGEKALKARASSRGMKITADQLKSLVVQWLATAEGDKARDMAKARIEAEAQLAAQAGESVGTLDLNSLLVG